jgi:Family of unknown function (DUF6428)
MKLSELKACLSELDHLAIARADGNLIPPHFHVTEVGLNTRHFIDCGGKVHSIKAVNLQIWVADDLDHRLPPHKLLNIIAASEELFGGEDLDVEVEYQTDTIGRYGLMFEVERFALQAKHTDCAH